MKRALISVSDKTNIETFSKALIEVGFDIISTGGTRRVLLEAGIPTTSIEEVTGFPEILDGRVKTLHPKVHGGLLSLRNKVSHCTDIEKNDITPIDLVCVNLYPFKETISKPGVSFEEAIEQVDIGGPSMLRSAAKNYEFVTVVTDIKDYDRVIREFRSLGDTSLQTKRLLSAKAFRTTAAYDAVIADFVSEDHLQQSQKTISLMYQQSLRYGENPHQEAALFQRSSNPYSLLNATLLHGKPLSYNNIQDANAALNIMKEHTDPTAVALKHMNPCGVACAETIEEAFDASYASDPVSIFGGIVAVNRPLTKDLANRLQSIFLEIVIAPSYEATALDVLQKKKNLRLIELDTTAMNTDRYQYVSINGGMLVQEVDQYVVQKEDLQIATTATPSSQQMDNLLFAWKVVKHVKSNAIVVTKGTKTVGIGAGQMNRVGAAKIALEWAKENGHTTDLILASDAFLPFDDVVKLAYEYGVTAIIQPGGSIRDKDSISACNDRQMVMVFTNKRHFKH